MTTTDSTDMVRRAAALAGHDHGWQHAESGNVNEGGLYAEPAVPERFAAAASWYTAAYAAGIAEFFVRIDTV